MITEKDGVFRLGTDHTSYWFRVTQFGHLEHIWYGPRLPEAQGVEPLEFKHTAMFGSTVIYDESDQTYCLDSLPLEWSGVGKGDYRHSPIEAIMPDGTFVSDFVYESHEIRPGHVPMAQLPTAYGGEGECESLIITLREKLGAVVLRLFYTVYPGCDTLTRRVEIENLAESPLTLRRFMSLMVDLPGLGLTMSTFDGGWSKEAHRHDREVQYGRYVNDSTTCSSSNRHNPGFLLAEQGAGEDHGRVYGFNLVYSGSHYSAVEKSNHDLVRVMVGISPDCFQWELGKSETFSSPEAILTCSEKGYNGVSTQFHDFVNRHIVRGDWKGKERPVLLNNWEAHFFKFTQGRLLKLARQAKRLGVELFVLDDGWFGARNSDSAGLGDYTVNRRKLPAGLEGLGRKIRAMGLEFGLWVEPESVNEDSDLYRAHPDWAIRVPGRAPARGRHQLLLDLCSSAVRDYIVDKVRATIEAAGVTYVKWDMNRHMSDFFSPSLPRQGELFHRYILGLYEVMGRIFGDKPEVLLETCSSGGNRFDLGMLCYSPQIWASDDTDPVERLEIQGGLSYLYPPSSWGAHVSSAPHQQTLRSTPLSTRFHVAAFGCLGYELDLKYLSPVEKKEVAAQIAWYKAHRRTLQFGRFTRNCTAKGNKVCWQSVGEGEAAVGFFQTRSTASEGYDILPLQGLEEGGEYTVETRPQGLRVKGFGALIHHILPVRLHPEGFLVRTADRHYMLPDCVERYEGTGAALMGGLQLNNQFVGSYYNEQTRLLGDFGSNMYLITKRSGNE